MQSADQFIADRVFPNVGVDHKSDSFYVYSRESWNRPQAKPRARATESAGGGWEVETASYNAERFAFHKDIDDQDRANQDAQFNIDREAAEFTAYQLLLTREAKFVSAFFGTGIWDTDLAGVAASPSAGQFVQWDAVVPTRSGTQERNPRADPTDRVQAQHAGDWPAGADGAGAACRYPRPHQVHRAGDGVDGPAGGVFGIDRILVPFPIRNTAAEGAVGPTRSSTQGRAPGVRGTERRDHDAERRLHVHLASLHGHELAAPITRRFRMEEITSDGSSRSSSST